MNVHDTSEVQDRGAAAFSPTRPFYWSLRREIWENRFLYLAPLIFAAFAIFGFCMSMIGMAERRRAVLQLGQAARRTAIQEPYDVVAMMLLGAGFLVSIFYCLEALYGERRDRSVLFWKSLPVSDTTTVLAKLCVPMMVMPLITAAIIICAQLIVLAASSMYLVAHGINPATTIENLQVGLKMVALPYGLVTLALWQAPVYGWLLLVSAWAKRVVFLWALLPFVGIALLEQVAFRTSRFGHYLQYRLGGGSVEAAFAFDKPGVLRSISQLTPFEFLTSPGLWSGLFVAALFIAGAIRLRRYREPI